MWIATGAYAFLPPDMVDERRQGAACNPELQPEKEGDKQIYKRKDPDAPHPPLKTDAVQREAALQGDHSFLNGHAHTSAAHSCQRTGVFCSHAFMKLSYWNDEACRNPDCMHCVYNELKAICDMICGGTGSPPAYDPKRLWQVADYEVHVNGRFHELQSYVSGKSSPLC